MLTLLAWHWRDPTARWATRGPYPHAVLQDGDGHAALGDMAVIILSVDIGRTHWAAIGVRRGVARGEVPPVSVTANAIASPGPSDPPSSMTA